MNRWVALLGETPSELQRLIARVQRISLPRTCTADERLRRLRAALCSAAAVRSVYASLDAETRAALADLRQRRGGIDADELALRYGVVRPLRQMARDPQPRSVAERLILIGWLLPRPPAPHPPQRYLLAPEVRCWLPKPLSFPDGAPAPVAPLPLALRATIALLLVCAAAPLPVRADGMLRRTALRTLLPLLANATFDDVAAVCAFLLPHLRDLGLVHVHHGRCSITPAAAPFLALSLEDQRARLIDAWIRSATPDSWLRRLRVASIGIDWLTLRQRLVQWVEVMPPGRLMPPDRLCAALVESFGPLADAHTHGFRVVRRAPWRAQSDTRVLLTALREPLHWLGLVAWHDGWVYRPRERATSDGDWRYGANGEVLVPFGGVGADALDLAQSGRWVCGDAQGLTWRMTRIPRAQEEALRQVLLRRAGPPPDVWGAPCSHRAPSLRLIDSVALVADTPGDLEFALRSRSVQRYVQTRLAPGIALVRPENIAALQRALARQGIAVAGRAPTSAAAPLPEGLRPGDCAALLVACAFYRRHAPVGMPLTIDETLESRLWSMLPPLLRDAVEAALAHLDAHSCSAAEGIGVSGNGHSPVSDRALFGESSQQSAVNNERDLLETLRRAIAQRRTVTIEYDTGGEGRVERRIVRPLELDQRSNVWYLRAYCLRRRAERTFRLDRVRAWTIS
ncbi:MAG: WYL domain-containing protein [Roseiflexaceae bacterium]|nr:WYL domain-containing protein [Roseiflexaceae bacterium]